MKLTSPAFEQGNEIPEKFTCQGKNISPALHLEGVPAEAKSLVLIMDDPDAPEHSFVHWAIYNIPPTTKVFEENNAPGVEATNDFGQLGYGGPCPPSGKHRYFFKVYALTQMLDLPNGANYKEVQKEMRKYFVPQAQAQLIGTYQKN